MAGAGPWAPVLALVFTSAVAVLPFPAEVPAALNGVLFGPVRGALLTWGGAMIGACLSYEAARRWGYPCVRRAVPAERADRAAELLDGRRGATGLLVLRLVPLVAFTLINWGAGLANVRRETFLWTTAVGIVPGVMLFTGGGAAVADLLVGSRPAPPLLAAVAGAVAVLSAGMVAQARTRRARGGDNG